MTFFVQQNLEEHAGHGGDDIFTTDSTCNLIKVLSLFYLARIGEGHNFFYLGKGRVR